MARVTFDRPTDDEARRLLRSARRRDRLLPIGIAVAALYLMSSCWGFVRPLGVGGPDVRVQAAPTVWGFAAIALVVVSAKVAARIAEDAGASPFAPPRWARRLLVVAAVALPLLLAGVEPTVAIMTVDAGSLQVPVPHWLVTVAATPIR
jgi:phosphatidylglycerophosphate synthase